MKKILLRIKHLFTGHPKIRCVEESPMCVRCECGGKICHYDYY